MALHKAQVTRLSKLLSHALRHEPWLYELELDEDGFLPVAAILIELRLLRTVWSHLSNEDLEIVVASSEKRRHEIVGDKIRALYGHSTPTKIIRDPSPPPDVLYHGTSHTLLSTNLSAGLTPKHRQYVHLSLDTNMAMQVGKRRGGKTVILVIRAREAFESGVPFYAGNEHVWLADRLPPEFISTDATE